MAKKSVSAKLQLLRGKVAKTRRTDYYFQDREDGRLTCVIGSVRCGPLDNESTSGPAAKLLYALAKNVLPRIAEEDKNAEWVDVAEFLQELGDQFYARYMHGE
jgi:glycine/D-amino acid oxidase-like deaminating enzyme